MPDSGARNGNPVREETIYEYLQREGVSRRQFIKYCGMVAGAMGLWAAPVLNGSARLLGKPDLTEEVIRALETKPRLPVIWLDIQGCGGCTEAFAGSQSPTLVDLMLDRISIDFHQMLFAAAGSQAETALWEATRTYAGKYVLVVEGSIPTGGEGAYCAVAGRSAVDVVREAAAGADVIIATGSCSAFGGIARATPDPTEARSVREIVTDKPVVNIPGCPAIPEVTTGTIARYIVFGTLPELDDLGRPKTFYGTTIHDSCLRRPFHDAGKFARSFDDEGARGGWCLYELGCRGPTTYNACATLKWGGGLSFPIQSGHPCIGCSQPDFWDDGGLYQAQSVPLDRPALTTVGMAAGVGALVGAAVAAAGRGRRKRVHEARAESAPEAESTPEPERTGRG